MEMWVWLQSSQDDLVEEVTLNAESWSTRKSQPFEGKERDLPGVQWLKFHFPVQRV